MDLSFSGPLDAALKLIALGIAGAIGALLQPLLEPLLTTMRAKLFH